MIASGLPGSVGATPAPEAPAAPDDAQVWHRDDPRSHRRSQGPVCRSPSGWGTALLGGCPWPPWGLFGNEKQLCSSVIRHELSRLGVRAGSRSNTKVTGFYP